PKIISVPTVVVPMLIVSVLLVPTMTLMLIELDNVPSNTVMVTSENATLFCPTAWIVTVRLAPLPPNEMLPRGPTAVFDEVALRIKLPAGVSRSPTRRFNVPVDEPPPHWP